MAHGSRTAASSRHPPHPLAPDPAERPRLRTFVRAAGLATSGASERPVAAGLRWALGHIAMENLGQSNRNKLSRTNAKWCAPSTRAPCITRTLEPLGGSR
jgi:hypothetical protein